MSNRAINTHQDRHTKLPGKPASEAHMSSNLKTDPKASAPNVVGRNAPDPHAPQRMAKGGADGRRIAGVVGAGVVGADVSIGAEKPDDGGKRKRRGLVIAAICVVVAVLIGLLVWLFVAGGSSMFDPNAQEGQAPYKTEEEIQAELDRVVDEGMFNISIASEITFEDGTSKGTAYIENVPGNRYNMQVTIVNADNPDEVYYASGVIKPNQYVADITLEKDLDAGSYPAVANFTALDPGTGEEIGEAAAKVTLDVKN